MDRINRSGTGIASLGRDEDQFLAHVALGERVVPPVISAATQARINQEMRAAGLDPNEYAVGSGMSINPITGLPEFGFFKKAFKSIKKVAKKVAPVAALIPGVGTAFGAALGGLGGLAGSALTKVGLGGVASTLGGLGSQALGGIAGLGIPGVSSIAGGAAQGFGGFKGLGSLSGMLKGGPLAGLTGTGASTVEVVSGDTLSQIAEKSGMTLEQLKAANPELASVFANPQSLQIGTKINIPGSGGFNLGKFISGTPGQQTPFQEFMDDKLGFDPSGGGIYNVLKGKGDSGSGLFGGGSGFGGGLASAGLGGFLGKLAYDAAKDKAGGLAVTPQVSMDALGRYQLASDLGTGGTRGQFGLAPKPAVLDIANMGQRQAFATGDEVVYDIPKMEFGPVGGFSKDSYYTLGIPKSYQDRSKNPGFLKELLADWAKMSVQGGELARENSPKYIEAIKQESGLQEGDPILDRILQEALKREVEGRNKFAVGGVAELDLREGGESIGPGTGTSDDIPAMLSDGEFVMTAAATKGAGAFNMKKNKSGIELIKSGKPSREDGVKNMRELMNIFEGM